MSRKAQFFYFVIRPEEVCYGDFSRDIVNIV
jgi:hypothetical protein